MTNTQWTNIVKCSVAIWAIHAILMLSIVITIGLWKLLIWLT